jgi:glycosyltransferase involved in cell wall biosynthesis
VYHHVAASGAAPVGIVHANDFQEGLLGLHLAKRFNTKSAIFLRSPTLTQQDYIKYGCNRYDRIFAVSDSLRERVQTWEAKREILLLYDGLLAEEFRPPKVRAPLPRRILVIGTPLRWKGWADVVEALRLLEGDGSTPALQFDFTGDVPGKDANDLGLERLVRMRCNFLGHTNAFLELVRQYDLVINASRMETFGVAAVEVVAAGVPLISSRTGVIEALLDEQLLFSPARPADLATTLKSVLARWGEIDFGLEQAQQKIRDRFMMEKSWRQLQPMYDAMSPERLVSSNLAYSAQRSG